MPQVKIDHIVSFSSEDPVHTASNILSSDSNKKWKCRSVGEKNASVVLQLEKASQITAIDIGNEHSAYIEVLVSRSSSNDDYKVLLVTSCFMSPVESRQSQNINKVRMFTHEHLSKPECDEKWDRVKIVCSQPFNKHVQFGLSFVRIHSNETRTSEAGSTTKIGKFVVRPESPDNISAGNLFAKRKEYKDEKPPTVSAAAAIRDVASFSTPPKCKPKTLSKHSTPKRQASSEEPANKNRNRDELFYDQEDLKGSEKLERIMKKKEEEDTLKRKMEEQVKKSPKVVGLQKEHKKTEIVKSPISSRKNEAKRKTDDRSANTQKAKKPKLSKPFNKLLDNVVFVISGIQNPERANLRSMALEMGAKYKADWDSTCTHLICAFINTPKFNQVKGKGKIVKRTWVQKCHEGRKRLPWRRFALDKSDASLPESEDEIDELLDIPSVSEHSFDVSDDEHKAEGSDTEERVAKILERQKQNQSSKGNGLDKTNSPVASTPSVFDLDTDEEETYLINNNDNPPPDFFKGMNIYINHSFGEDAFNTLQKYVKAYKGKCLDYITDDTDVIVTNTEGSLLMKENHPSVKCVEKMWILKCHKKQTILPIDEYIY